MKRPVFSFRPALEDAEHRRAWEILQRVPPGQKNTFLVKAILTTEDEECLKRMIRQAVREELSNIQLISENPTKDTQEGIPEQMLEFLSAMEEYQ